MNIPYWRVVGLTGLLLAGRAEAKEKFAPQVVTAAQVVVSRPVRELDRAARPLRTLAKEGVREIPLGRLPRPTVRPRLLAAEKADPVVQRMFGPPSMPEPLFTFEGISNLDGVYPPDVNGDVGLDHYVEMVNLHMCIYDKATGTNVVAPFLMSSLYAAAGFGAPASTTDDGDPVVLYDHLAHRWMISQFIVSVTPCHEVIGISQTSDPTGAWYLYDFVMPNNKMNDYPHFGMWPDGYYMTDNQFDGNSWGGAGVFAFDRAKMLAGDTNATYQYFDLYGVNADFGGMLPADLDGPPPPEGTPCPFLMVDDSYVNGFDAMYQWDFHVDWTNPANSTFGNSGHPNATNAVAPFDSTFDGGRNNIPQPGTAQKLDAIADRLMHRVQYRNFNSYETLVASHTVDAGVNHAGVRWYVMERANPAAGFGLADQGTHAPDSAHRWMGSAALDGQGNLAVGYSCSDTNIYPSIRYAGRLATDPTGSLYQGEAEMYTGSGSQTGTGARWGDYTMMSVDPADEVTFWYVNEYYPVTAAVAWHTRIGAFRMGAAEQGVVYGVVTNALTGEAVAGAMVASSLGYATPTLSNGTFRLALPTGLVALAASAVDYETSAVANVEVLLNVTTEQNFALSPIPMRVTPRTGLAATGMEGGPFSPASATYTVTNASLDPLVWTAELNVAWATLSTNGGTLAAGSSATLTVALNYQADFLAVASYAGALLVSNVTDGAQQSRPLSLAVEPRLVTLLCEDFPFGLPAGWQITNNGSPVATATWQIGETDNLTGGSGGLAFVDDDQHGESVVTDTELITIRFHLEGLSDPVLQFKTHFNWYESEVADVDVSTQGVGGPWSNVWRKTADYAGAASASLATWAGQSNVQVRFHYNDYGGWGYWWQVDDVCVKGVPVSSSGNLTVKPEADWTASGYAGGPFTPDRLYRLGNESAGPLEWSLFTNVAWLSVNQTNGTLASGATTDLVFTVSGVAEGYAPGVYAGTLGFTNITEGLAQTRSVSLTVLEPLVATPETPWRAEGLEGGPFTPASVVYVVSNQAAQGMLVSIMNQQPWLALSSTGGTLDAGASWSVTGTLADAALTVPGIYADLITISNAFSGSVLERAVTVTVVEIRGDIAVYDSVAPTNDLRIPFGAVAPYTAVTQTVLVVNDDLPGGRDLSLSEIFLGYVSEDFSDGFAQGWREDVDTDWNVSNGLYVAQAPGANFLTAVYTDSVVRADFSFSVTCSRTGATGWAQGLALRASADFDADGTGQAYAFVFDGEMNYAVFWLDGTGGAALQGWSPTTAIRTNQANTLAASAEGTNLFFFINNTLVWSGSDSHFATGRVALMGYNDATAQPSYRFAAAQVQPPLRPASALGRKQIYLNSIEEPDSRITGTRRATPMPEYPDDPAGPVSPLSPGITMAPYTLTNLPTMPAILGPGDSAVFDVIYAPASVGTNRNAITLHSDDNEEPFVSVELTGRVEQGLITGLVTSAYSGLGLAGVRVVAQDGSSNWTTVTTASGSYRLPVFSGTHEVSAELAAYTTGVVAGVVVADGGTVAANFVLTGSELTYAPTGITVTLNYGDGQTNTIWLTNSGPLDIEVALAAFTMPGHAPYQVPAFTGSLPASPSAPSSDRAIRPVKPVDGAPPTRSAPTRRLCYGVDMDMNRLVYFYSDVPQTLFEIGSVGANLIPCVDFLNYDFSKLYALDYVATQLVTFATSNAAKTVVGAATPEAGHGWTGLAGAPDGTLYAASTDGTASYLYTLDPLTGAATTVGEITGAPGIIAIACPVLGPLYGVDIVNDNLVRIDAATGAGTVIGPLGFDASYAQGMDFDEAGEVLYLAAYNVSGAGGELRIVDTETGATELVGAFEERAEMCMAVASDPHLAWLTFPQATSSVQAANAQALPLVLDTQGLENQASTNYGRVVFSGSYVNDAPDLPVTLILRADPLQVTPSAPATLSGPPGGSFTPIWFAYALSNRGPAALAWSVTLEGDWLTLSSAGGTLAAGGTTSLLASLNNAVNSLTLGGYTGRLSVVNQTSGAEQAREIRLSVVAPGPDYFTELFTVGNDLAYRTLTFTPILDAPYYTVCSDSPATNFPVDPAGGTTLVLTDDGSVEVNFTGGLTVPLYGVAYTNFYVGGNGFLTFGTNDEEYLESLEEHFNLPRVAVLFDDLSPDVAGSVSWKPFTGGVAVTWQGIREYETVTSNSFQAELFSDGMIRLTWLGIAAADGLAGLSAGDGVPGDFMASDLSSYAACGSFVDSDGDGMGDDWEIANGLFVGLDDAAANPDGDAFLNGEEFVADTQPTNALSQLALELLMPYVTNCWAVVWTNGEPPYEVGTNLECETIGTILNWPASTARVYDVELSTGGLALAWSGLPGSTNLTPAGSVVTVTNLSGAESLRLLRVRARLP